MEKACFQELLEIAHLRQCRKAGASKRFYKPALTHQQANVSVHHRLFMLQRCASCEQDEGS